MNCPLFISGTRNFSMNIYNGKGNHDISLYHADLFSHYSSNRLRREPLKNVKMVIIEVTHDSQYNEKRMMRAIQRLIL